jgi:hypothetical protein
MRPPRLVIVLVCLAMLLSACATPGPATVSALRAAAATPIGDEEMKALLPGARVVYTSRRGVTSTWWNTAGGTLTATQDRTTLSVVMGHGRWWQREDATFCFEIQWQAGPSSRWSERNCDQLWRVGDDIFGAWPLAADQQPLTRYRFQHPIRQEAQP